MYNDSRLDRMEKDLENLTQDQHKISLDINTLRTEKEHDLQKERDKLQQQMELTLKRLIDTHDRRIADLQKEYDRRTRRIPELQRDIERRRKELDRERERSAANDNNAPSNRMPA